MTITQARVLVTMLGRERRALEMLGKRSGGFVPGHRYGTACRALERQGLIMETRSGNVYPHRPYFHLTDDGWRIAEILKSGDPDYVPAGRPSGEDGAV